MKRFIAFASAFALLLALTGCTSAKTDGTSSDEQQSSSQEQVQQETDYSKGTHHAVMRLKGYQDPVKIEIYSDSAPETAAAFCKLAEEKYYDGKTLFWVLDNMYIRGGNSKAGTEKLVKGEFSEAGFNNSVSLKEGTIALARAQEVASSADSDDSKASKGKKGKDGSRAASDEDASSAQDGSDGARTVTQSDASSFIIFLSDMSYLDSKYAGFAKITSGMDTISLITERTQTTDKKKLIETDKTGKIKKKKDRPTIASIRMID